MLYEPSRLYNIGLHMSPLHSDDVLNSAPLKDTVKRQAHFASADRILKSEIYFAPLQHHSCEIIKNCSIVKKGPAKATKQ